MLNFVKICVLIIVKLWKSELFCCVLFIYSCFSFTETKNYTDKISLLEEEITALKTAKASFLKDIDMLEEKLSESQVENGKSEKIIHDQCETISTLENGKILNKLFYHKFFFFTSFF